eukprot:gene4288-3061_t
MFKSSLLQTQHNLLLFKIKELLLFLLLRHEWYRSKFQPILFQEQRSAFKIRREELLT